MTIRKAIADTLNGKTAFVLIDTKRGTYYVYGTVDIREDRYRYHTERGYLDSTNPISELTNIRYEDERYRLIKWTSPNTGHASWAVLDTTTGYRGYLSVYREKRVKELAELNAGRGEHVRASQFTASQVTGEWQYDDDNNEPKEETVTDYEEKYNNLVKALEKEARDRNWCSEWDTFRKANGIEKKYPDEPQGYGLVIRFPGWTPVFKYQGTWRHVTQPTEGYTWKELIDLRGTEFKILSGQD